MIHRTYQIYRGSNHCVPLRETWTLCVCSGHFKRSFRFSRWQCPRTQRNTHHSHHIIQLNEEIDHVDMFQSLPEQNLLYLFGCPHYPSHVVCANTIPQAYQRDSITDKAFAERLGELNSECCRPYLHFQTMSLSCGFTVYCWHTTDCQFSLVGLPEQ